ncbi:MAG: glycosyltransferase [Acidobacteriota bacterium]
MRRRVRRRPDASDRAAIAGRDGHVKVLHLGKYFPPSHGGMETHLSLLASRLAPLVEVDVAVAAGDQPHGRETVGGVTVHRMRTLGVLASTPICPELFTIIRDVRPDLVHLHHPHPLAMLGYLASGSRVPCVVGYHSDIVRQRVLGRLTAPIVRATLRRSGAILVASPHYLESSTVLQPFRRTCHVVPYGFEPIEPARIDQRAVAELRARYGPRLVLAVGRLTAYKGFEYLVRAMADVDARLLIVGEGPCRPMLERLVSTLGLHDHVTLLGAVPDVAPYYEACDVFVLPSISRNEAFGIVQLEAMAAGRPVVNTAIGSGVEYACPPGLCGLAVAPADPAALAGAIRQLLADPALRRALGAAGRARVTAEFSAAEMVRQTLNIYQQAVLVGAGATASRAAAKAARTRVS